MQFDKSLGRSNASLGAQVRAAQTLVAHRSTSVHSWSSTKSARTLSAQRRSTSRAFSLKSCCLLSLFEKWRSCKTSIRLVSSRRVRGWSSSMNELRAHPWGPVTSCCPSRCPSADPAARSTGTAAAAHRSDSMLGSATRRSLSIRRYRHANSILGHLPGPGMWGCPRMPGMRAECAERPKPLTLLSRGVPMMQSARNSKIHNARSHARYSLARRNSRPTLPYRG